MAAHNSDVFASVLVTGGAGFIGSNLVAEIQRRFPASQITVIDDFRSVCFENLRQFSGDVMAFNLAELDVERTF